VFIFLSAAIAALRAPEWLQLLILVAAGFSITVADVPTLKFVGFMYMVIGIFFLVATASGGFG